MNLKKATELSSSFKFMIDNLNIISSIAKNSLLEKEFCNNTQLLNQELDKISFLRDIIIKNKYFTEEIALLFHKLKNIKGTLTRLHLNFTIDDVELFEIKEFSFIAKEINLLCKKYIINIINIPDTDEIIQILDPDNTKISGFYIYDSYSPQLKELRKKIKLLDINSKEHEQYRQMSENIEINIRQQLSSKICTHINTIEIAILEIVSLDIMIAKAVQSIDMNLSKPVFTEQTTKYTELRNPFIETLLSKYQAIDIEIPKRPTLITGANMSGKTMILKTILLNQLLAQYGFYVPAKIAEICVVDKIMLCLEDKQDETKGLSSFAAELIEIDNIITESFTNSNILVLIDEPARTTNPYEGCKIVNAILEILNNNHIRSLLTTHYENITSNTRKLRVKGLKKNIDHSIINKDNINNYVDYSLVETERSDVPHDAILIAEILGVSEKLLNMLKENS